MPAAFLCNKKPLDSLGVQKRLTVEKIPPFVYNKSCDLPVATNKTNGGIMQKEIFIGNSLAHTKWNCKYHIVFAPKYRRKVFFDDKRQEIRDILRTLCKWKGVEIIEGEVCPDHIHLLLSIPPKISVSGFMGDLKGKSSLMIFQKFGNLKFAYRNREFWCRGFYVDTSGKDTKAIKEYIANQLQQDKETDQLSIFNSKDPFTGSK